MKKARCGVPFVLRKISRYIDFEEILRKKHRLRPEAVETYCEWEKTVVVAKMSQNLDFEEILMDKSAIRTEGVFSYVEPVRKGGLGAKYSEITFR